MVLQVSVVVAGSTGKPSPKEARNQQQFWCHVPTSLVSPVGQRNHNCSAPSTLS